MNAALIAKLESASEGSRELDARVECAVQGFDFVTMHHGWYVAAQGGSAQQMSPPNPYTTSIDAALALAERVLPGWSWGIATDHERGFGCVMTPDEKSDRSFAVWASTPALAICAALLRASAAEGAG